MSTDLIEDVSDDTYVCEIKNITLTPAFPEPGKELRLDLDAVLTEQVDLSQVECQFQMKLGVVSFIRKTYLLPDLLTAWGAELSGDLKPPAGPWTQSWTFKLPTQIPKGDFRLYLTSYTENEMDFMDLKAHVDFRRK